LGGLPVEPEEGGQIFLKPLYKTSPEVVWVAIRWDEFDDKGVPTFYLTLDAEVHREEPRSHLLKRWIDHFKAVSLHPEIAFQLLTDENEYYWTDHVGKETRPPLRRRDSPEF
jgi:hypothetical protein